MMAAANDFYGTPTRPKKKVMLPKDESEQAKRRRRELYGADQTEHDYIIKGVVIRATSKKVAKKIYERLYKRKTDLI